MTKYLIRLNSARFFFLSNGIFKYKCWSRHNSGQHQMRLLLLIVQIFNWLGLAITLPRT